MLTQSSPISHVLENHLWVGPVDRLSCANGSCHQESLAFISIYHLERSTPASPIPLLIFLIIGQQMHTLYTISNIPTTFSVIIAKLTKCIFRASSSGAKRPFLSRGTLVLWL